MLRSCCLLRIGVSQVYGAWLPGRAGGRFAEATAPFEAGADQQWAGLGGAISSVLTQILPRSRLMAPYVSVGLAGAHVSGVIMTFAKLPKSAADRSLLISQRFCRESHADHASVTVLGSRLGVSKNGGDSVLCLAVPNALLAEIVAPLAERGLHADEIAPDYMLAFAEADTRELNSPGLVLMERSGCSTILVWDSQRTIVHLWSHALEPEDAEAGHRMTARILRYAKIIGGEGRAVTVYADGPVPEALALKDRIGEQGLTLLRWPSGQGRWGLRDGALGL